VAQKGAKPVRTEVIGYNRNGKQIQQVKIATSNLFIDTTSLPIDYMTGAIFDGIGGNEFINGGSSEIILQDANSLVSNASDIQFETNTKTNEKQADGSETFLSQFEIALNSYLPTTNSSPQETLGYSAPMTEENPGYVQVPVQFIEKNVYFDENFQNICIELTNLPDGEQVEVEFITSYSSVDSGII
jgi:hypothetical protein